MFRVNGLYGHIRRNNAKAAVLILSFIGLFMCMQAILRALPLLMNANVASSMGRAIDAGKMEKELDEVLRTAPFNLGKTFDSKSLAKGMGADLDPKRAAAKKVGAESGEIAKPAAPPSIFEVLSHAFKASHFYDLPARLLLMMAIIHIIVASWWNTLFIRYATRAKPLARADFPELYDVVENLAISVGIPCPAIEIVDTPKLNAYATGLTPKSARLGLTTGLIEKLSRDELEAVIAHELTHIRQGDSRLMAVLKACVDLVLPNQKKLQKSFGGHPFGYAFAAILAFSIFGWKFLSVLAVLIGALMAATYAAKAMVLHAREFVADAGAIELTKNPAALISALLKISEDDRLPIQHSATQAMMFSGDAGGVFSTHPTVEARIAAIQEHADVSPADVTAERARRVRAVARPDAPPPVPAFGRRRVVQGLGGFRSEEFAAASRHAMDAIPDAVWREQPVFSSRQSVGASEAAPRGDSLFETWILSGRLERAGDVAKKVAFAPVRLWAKVQIAVLGFGLVMAFLVSLTR